MARETQDKRALMETVTMPSDALDCLPSGVLKINKSGDITYANDAFLKIAGISSLDDMNIKTILPDKENYAIVSEHMKRRYSEMIGEEYEVVITRQIDGRKVHVNVLALPELNGDGQIVGSLALIRDLTTEHISNTAQNIHRHIATERDWRKMLEGTAEEIKKLVSYEWFNVSLYSGDRRHTRELFSYPVDERHPWTTRWFEMPTIARRFIESKDPIIIGDLEAFLDQPEWQDVKNQPATKQFLQLGFHSCLWYPVLHGNKIVAAIALYTRSVNEYRNEDLNILATLPVSKATSMALYYLERRDLEFRLSLMKDISSASRDGRYVGDIIVEKIAEHYEWENVSVFRIDENQQKLRLLSQKAALDEYLIDPDYAQDLDTGIISHVYKTGEAVNIGNVKTSAQFKDLFVRAYSPTVSELCIPIKIDGKVVALLNSEDSRENAFSEEEKQALIEIMNELGAFLERLRLYEVLEATLKSARDIVIVTDSHGVIKQANPAAYKLLKYAAGELIGTHLGDHIESRDLAGFLISGRELESKEVKVLRKNGESTKILLSSSTLPDDIGGKVYAGIDLSVRRSSERIELLKDLFHEIGIQTQSPISLISGWLHSLHKSAHGDELKTIEKALHQLRKLEISFDRLMLFERKGSSIPSNPVHLITNDIVEGILGNLPERDTKRIKFSCVSPSPAVRGDLFQFSFCIESILSYLLRFADEDESISITIDSDGEIVTTLISGKAPEITGEDAHAYADKAWIVRTVTEMRLGEKMLRSLIEDNMQGNWHDPKRRDNYMDYRFDLPRS